METLPLLSSAAELSFSARLLVVINGRSLTESGIVHLLSYAVRFEPRAVVDVVVALPIDGLSAFGAVESVDGFVPLVDVASIDELVGRDRVEATAIRKFVEASLRQLGLTGSVAIEHRSVFDVAVGRLSMGSNIDAVIVARTGRGGRCTGFFERRFGLTRRLERNVSVPVIALGAR